MQELLNDGRDKTTHVASVGLLEGQKDDLLVLGKRIANDSSFGPIIEGELQYMNSGVNSPRR